MRGQRGITLLEVALATVLLGVAATGLLGTINHALAGIRGVREHSQAVLRAKSVLEEILALPRLRAGQAFQGSGNDTSGWRASIEPLQPTSVRLEASGLVRIQVEVWWLSDDQRKSLNLEGYRRREIR